MTKKAILTVEDTDITILAGHNKDYFSLTDIAKRVNPDSPADLIANWMRNKDTIELLEIWEKLHNPNFNLLQLEEVKKQVGLNRFLMSPTKWIETTNAVGMVTKTGRYGGGTFAHKDIAMAFCFWISPGFQLLVITEFQRLKAIEAEEQQEHLDWNLKRTLAKVNYRVHTDAVKMYLIPPRLAGSKQEGIVYASQADILNLALFGITAKQWREQNADLKGNIRDHATTEQLLVLVNLENLNAHFIKEGLAPDERLDKLNEIAIYQMQLLANPDVGAGIKQLPPK
jgi:hypothetical protein